MASDIETRLAEEWKAIEDEASFQKEPVFEFRDTDREYWIFGNGYIEMRRLTPERHARIDPSSREAISVQANRIGTTLSWAIGKAQRRTQEIMNASQPVEQT